MSFYSGLSLREVYERSCEDMGCKKNSTFAKTLPETPDLFTVPTHIDISTNFLGPRGLKPLFEVVRIASELRVLNLADQQMTNESITDLCAVVRNHPSLTHIDLSKNPITIAAGMELVEMLKENKSIEVIALDQTDLKPTVLNLIKAQLEKNTINKRGVVNAAAAAAGSASSLNSSAVDGAVVANSTTSDAIAAVAAASLTQEIDDHAVRAAYATIPSTINFKVLDADPSAALRVLCADFGKIFTDPQFPADNTSIQKTEANEYFVTHKKWKRISQYVAEKNLIANSNENDKSSSLTEADRFAASPAGDIFGPRVGEVAFSNSSSSASAATYGAANCTAVTKGFNWQWTTMQACISKGNFSQKDTRSLISPATVNPLGFYVVKLFIDAEWRYVVVDDQLPVDTEGKFVFTGPASAESGGVAVTTYFWAAILEKALAKVCGSYQSLDTSVPQSVKHVLEKAMNPAMLMRDITGGIGISRDIQHQQFDSREWWQTMLALPTNNTAMVAFSSDAEARCEPAGIDPSHAYAILQVRQINGFSLIQLRSTFAQRRYCDAWHDQCQNWSDYPLIADALGIARKADPFAFWIPYHRFLFLFKSVHLCRLFPHYNARAMSGEWTEATSGGPYFGGHWGLNPHFKFSVTERSNVFINLALCDQRFKESEQVETLGFHLIKSGDKDYPIEFHGDEEVAKTEYVITNAVSYEGALSSGDYWLIPSSYTPGKLSRFWLRIFSTSPMVLSHEPESRYWTQRAVSVDVPSSGEYQNGEDNAQVELKIAPTPAGVTSFKIAVVVDVMEASNDTNVIAFLVKPQTTLVGGANNNIAEVGAGGASSPASPSSASSPFKHDPSYPLRFVGVIPDANIVAKSPFVVGDRVCLEATVDVPEHMQMREQRFIIVPCVTPQKTKAKVLVTVFLSEPKFGLSPLPLWPRRAVSTAWTSSAPFLKLPYYRQPEQEGGVAVDEDAEAAIDAVSVTTALTTNPQIELCPHDAEPHFIINMEVSNVVDPLIAFAVVVNDTPGKPLLLKNFNSSPTSADVGSVSNGTADVANGERLTFVNLPEGKVIGKSRYIRHTSVTFEVRLPREVRASSYVIVPYLQPAGSSGNVTITVSNQSGGFSVRNLTAV